MRKLYYHFTSNKLRDGRPIPPTNEWLVHEGEVIMCTSGLHASEQPYDALQYAPGHILHRVELDDVIDTQDDKVVARRRKIVATIDAAELLHAFARKQALSVIHLWNCPAITKQYLETGDVSMQGAAWSAARSAAQYAAQNAARSAAGAARSAADAAQSAADAAWSAIREQFNAVVEEAFIEQEKTRI